WEEEVHVKVTLKGAAHAAATMLFVGAWAPAAQAQPVPSATDIGTLGGIFSQAVGISDSGHGIGASTVAGDLETHAFILTEHDGMVDLGTLGGTISLPAGTFSLGDQPGRGVNNRGDVVGVSSTAGNQYSHAFLWSAKDGMVDLGTLGGTFSQAAGI